MNTSQTLAPAPAAVMAHIKYWLWKLVTIIVLAPIYCSVIAEGLRMNLSLLYFLLFVPVITLISMIPVSLNGMGSLIGIKAGSRVVEANEHLVVGDVSRRGGCRLCLQSRRRRAPRRPGRRSRGGGRGVASRPGRAALARTTAGDQ